VVEEIMPFSESSAAVLKFTEEDLTPSFTILTEELNIFESSQIWQMEGSLEDAHVHILSLLIDYFCYHWIVETLLYRFKRVLVRNNIMVNIYLGELLLNF
jgi:hypothetical protein